MKKIYEGMRSGDLADLVLPLLSVDEFESKLDEDECVVFGLYVHDKDAAADLNRFLQKSATQILDVDISPAPDQHGYYMVFLELMNNTRLPENMISILAELQALVDIDNDGWEMRVRNHDELVPFTEKNLKNCLDDLKKHDKRNPIKEWFSTSVLRDVMFEDNLLILQGRERFVFEMVDFGKMASILDKHNLKEAPILNHIKHISRSNRIRTSLGEGWDVSLIGKHIAISNNFDDRVLLAFNSQFNSF
jgi:hypothetical protein